METMGLLRTAHWVSWIGWEGVVALLSSLVIQALGYAFQFDLWRYNDFRLTFLLVLLNNLVLTALAFLFSTFMHRASSTVSVGFVCFFVAWILMLVSW